MYVTVCVCVCVICPGSAELPEFLGRNSDPGGACGPRNIFIGRAKCGQTSTRPQITHCHPEASRTFGEQTARLPWWLRFQLIYPETGGMHTICPDSLRAWPDAVWCEGLCQVPQE